LIKLINSYLTNRKFRVLVEGELSTPREIEAEVPQGSLLAPILYSLYINDTSQTPGVHLAHFADDTCLYTTDRRDSYVLKKLQRGLKAMEGWCKKWNIKINDDKTQAVSFSERLRRVEAHIMLKGRAITFVDTVKYLGVTFDRKITWKTHIDWIVTKCLRTFLQIYSLLKSDKLSTKTKITLYKALIRSK
jgi:hypothetical protein